MSIRSTRRKGKSGQVRFERGVSYTCGKCGKKIARKGPFVLHERTCEGPVSDWRLCGNCGRSFHKRSFGGHRVGCLGRNSFSNPNVHRVAMQKRSRNQVYLKHLSNRMKGNLNPAKREEVKAKMRKGTKEAIARGLIPYGRGAGGKGRGLTYSEKQVGELLRPLGFEGEYKVLTGLPKGFGNATWYSLDFAHPKRKIAVEVDGSSHQNRRDIDDKKDAWLLENGWAVIRVPASQVKLAERWLLAECSKSRQCRRRVRRFMISK